MGEEGWKGMLGGVVLGEGGDLELGKYKIDHCAGLIVGWVKVGFVWGKWERLQV